MIACEDESVAQSINKHSNSLIYVVYKYPLGNESPQPLKVTYHPLYSMNKFVTDKSKSPEDGA